MAPSSSPPCHVLTATNKPHELGTTEEKLFNQQISGPRRIAGRPPGLKARNIFSAEEAAANALSQMRENDADPLPVPRKRKTKGEHERRPRPRQNVVRPDSRPPPPSIAPSSNAANTEGTQVHGLAIASRITPWEGVGWVIHGTHQHPILVLPEMVESAAWPRPLHSYPQAYQAINSHYYPQAYAGQAHMSQAYMYPSQASWAQMQANQAAFGGNHQGYAANTAYQQAQGNGRSFSVDFQLSDFRQPHVSYSVGQAEMDGIGGFGQYMAYSQPQPLEQQTATALLPKSPRFETPDSQ
ncbi:hypothetical protein FZEAL_9680 [Fusarium zealandicum]|uniref:Uncharacterized protein n=1 Tax=Fusarium zealandicum TaxID=1053134 RepID=A0A8H4U9C3_9HYPO|nr:hypothetical protein FZEAL_9680 [Fusarium zealandicum]